MSIDKTAERAARSMLETQPNNCVSGARGGQVGPQARNTGGASIPCRMRVGALPPELDLEVAIC